MNYKHFTELWYVTLLLSFYNIAARLIELQIAYSEQY